MEKYKFTNIVGNVSTVTLLRNAIIADSLPNLVIFEGFPGTGKSSSALITSLALTCTGRDKKSPDPCLKCPSCRTILKSMNGGNARTPNMVKVNLGHRTKGDVDKLIEEVFMLKNEGKKVYVFEETHSLDKKEQLAFMEEIDRIDSDTYIIVNTTSIHSLLPEFKSRGITLHFNRLLRKESLLFIDRTIASNGYKKFDNSTIDLIIKKTRGTPRDMENLLEFINNTKPSYEQILEFLNEIDFEVFSRLLEAMFGNTSEFITMLNEMFNRYQIDLFIARFKDYLLEAAFYQDCGVSENLSRFDKKVIDDINRANPTVLSKFTKSVYKLTNLTTDTDLKFLLFTLKQSVNNKSLANVVTDVKRDADLSRRDAEVNKELKEDFAKPEVKMQALDLEAFIARSKQ